MLNAVDTVIEFADDLGLRPLFISMVIEIIGRESRISSEEITMNRVFKALADPTRREILRLLTRGEQTAGALADHFAMSKATVSHHFNVLKDAELIRSRREGPQIFYALNTTVVQDVLAWALSLMNRCELGSSSRTGTPTDTTPSPAEEDQ